MDSVNLFDGKTVTPYKVGKGPLSIMGESVQSPFYEADNGDVFFTTNEAIHRYARQSGRFSAERITSLASPDVHNIFHLENDSLLWVEADGKLYRRRFPLRPPHQEQLLLDDFQGVRGEVVQDKTDGSFTLLSAFWRRDLGMEIMRFSNTGKLLMRDTLFSKLKPDSLSFHTISKVVTDGSNIAWVETDDGIIGLDISRPRSNHTFISSPIASVSIVDIVNGRDSSLMVLLASGELTTLDKATGKFTGQFFRFHDLETRASVTGVKHIYVDRNNTIWLAKSGVGVYYGKLVTSNFSSLFSEYDLERASVTSLI